MGRYTSEGSGGSFKQAPAGTHVARAIKIIDLGTQHGEYLGEPTVRSQIVVQWELPNETLTIDGEDKPFIVSCFYTNSLNEKAKLRADLETWSGKGIHERGTRPFRPDEYPGQAVHGHRRSRREGEGEGEGDQRSAEGDDLPAGLQRGVGILDR